MALIAETENATVMALKVKIEKYDSKCQSGEW